MPAIPLPPQDLAGRFDEGEESNVLIWPTRRRWEIYWFLVEQGTATVLDICYELGLSQAVVRCALETLGGLRLIHTVQISRPAQRAFRTVYGPSLHGLFYCERCDQLFLPLPVWNKEVKHCPYCGTSDIVQEPRDPKTGLSISDPR